MIQMQNNMVPQQGWHPGLAMTGQQQQANPVFAQMGMQTQALDNRTHFPTVNSTPWQGVQPGQIQPTLARQVQDQAQMPMNWPAPMPTPHQHIQVRNAWPQMNYRRAFDQQSITFLESMATQVEQEVMKATISMVQYPDLIRIFTGMNPNADMLQTYVGMPGVGRMVPLAQGGMDFPNVANQMTTISTTASSYGVGYMWTLEEIEKAEYMGYNLPMDRVEVAYQISELQKEQFVLHGDQYQQWRGLFTNTDKNCLYLAAGDAPSGEHKNTDGTVTKTVNIWGDTANVKYIGGAGTWKTGQTHEAFSQICRMYTEIVQNSRDTLRPDTLLLSRDLMNFLVEPFTRTGTGLMEQSLWQYLVENSPYKLDSGGMPMRVRTVYDLPKGTLLMYNSSIQTLRFILARDLEFTGPQQWGYEMRWFGRMKVGGIQFLRPKNMCYMTVNTDSPQIT